MNSIAASIAFIALLALGIAAPDLARARGGGAGGAGHASGASSSAAQGHQGHAAGVAAAASPSGAAAPTAPATAGMAHHARKSGSNPCYNVVPPRGVKCPGGETEPAAGASAEG